MTEQAKGKPGKANVQAPAGQVRFPISTGLPMLPMPPAVDMPAVDDESFWQDFWQKFWQKIKAVAKVVGVAAKNVVREVIKLALLLCYALHDDDTPNWAKIVAFGALVYFINPLDAIPDTLPGGLADDLAILSAVATTVVVAYIKPEHRAKAQAWIDDGFGSESTG